MAQKQTPIIFPFVVSCNHPRTAQLKLDQKNLAVTEINGRLANTPTVVLINGERDRVRERVWRHYRRERERGGITNGSPTKVT
jgi:hypothetical protein